MLLDCFLADLLALLGAFWAQLGASWAPLGLILGPLGRLGGPLGRHVGLPKRTWMSNWPAKGHLGVQVGLPRHTWTPVGRQMDANWTPSERQVGLPQRLQISTHSLRTSQQLPNPTEHLANSTFCRRMATLCNTSIYYIGGVPYIYIYII